jgi:hypothetical protein
MFQIEKHIPVPEFQGYRTKYRFKELEIGESFLVPYEDGDEHALAANRVQSAARAAAKSTGWKFTTRKLNTGIRVWRVE